MWSLVASAVGSSSRRRLLGAVAAVMVACLVAGCGSAGASGGAPDPETTAVAEPTTTTVAPSTTTAPTTSAAPTTTTAAPISTTTAAPPPALPRFTGPPLAPGANSVYVLGDSVILGAASTVPPALSGWDVNFDAKESRRLDQGTGIVRARGGAMGRVLVVHLCTNWFGGDYGAAADKLLGSLDGVERVVWLTCVSWLPEVGAADDAIRALPGRHPEVVVVDWAAVSGSPGYTYADGLHLRPDGAAALAQLIAEAVGPAPAG